METKKEFCHRCGSELRYEHPVKDYLQRVGADEHVWTCDKCHDTFVIDSNFQSKQ